MYLERWGTFYKCQVFTEVEKEIRYTREEVEALIGAVLGEPVEIDHDYHSRYLDGVAEKLAEKGIKMTHDNIMDVS